MNYMTLVFEIIFISMTGVMLPGAMTAVTLSRGAESPYSGILISIGHGIVEVPLIIIIFLGFSYLVNFTIIKIIIAFGGSFFLILTGIGMFFKIKETEASKSILNPSRVMTGILFSIGNPAFILWWLTLGAALIMKVSKFGTLFLIAFIIIHLLCDLLWLFFLSALSFKGGQFFGRKFQKILFVACGILLFFFSIKYFIDGLNFFHEFISHYSFN
jgi:threonine/homoserine/homoserine lactone efflux protein